MTVRRSLWVLIAVASLLRLALALSIGGFLDEAYYVLYGQNLDWAFFDHPPMTGVVAALGAGLAGWISPVVGLRFGFIVMFAGSSWLLARITERFYDARAALLAVLVLNSTVFFGILVGGNAGPDGPLLFFWLLTLDRLSIALRDGARTRDWLGVGLAWGLAMLSKYHAVLLPAGALLYLAVRPRARRCLLTPGPYLASAMGLAAFAPVVLWNARHGWASFLFHAHRSGGFQGIRPEFVLEAVVGQVAYLTPWLYLCLLSVLIALIRRGPRRWTDAEAFLFCQAAPAIVLFMGVSTFSRILTHWPLIGFVALMPVLGRNLSERLDARPVLVRNWLICVMACPVVLAAMVVGHANLGLFQDGRGQLLGLFPPEFDLTVDMIRWDQIADELERRGLTDDPNTFLFTDNWRYSSQLALATNYKRPVACFCRDSRGFTFWSRPKDWLGRDGVFVRVIDGLAEPEFYAPWFRRVEPLADFHVTRAGVPIQTVRITRCVRLTAPFQFGYTGLGPIPRPGLSPDPGGKAPSALTARAPGAPAARR